MLAHHALVLARKKQAEANQKIPPTKNFLSINPCKKSDKADIELE